MLAAAGVEGYLRNDNPKVFKVMEECPSLASDLLREAKVLSKSQTLWSLQGDYSAFADPITGERLNLPISQG